MRWALLAITIAVALEFPAPASLPASVLQQAMVPQHPRVPALVGLPVDSAVRVLSRMKIMYDTSLRIASPLPYNSVVRQAPAPGTPVQAGMVVQLAVSSGNSNNPMADSLVVVPDVTGRDTLQAMLALRHSGLAMGRVEPVASGSATGLVLQQAPPAGSRVPPGTVITLQIAAQPSRVVVPPVVGLEEAKAIQIIEAAGLFAAPITHTSSPPGNHQVVREHPEPGAMVARGSAVALDVAVPLPPPAQVLVPHVEGRTPAEADAILENVELHLGNVVVIETTTTANRVLHQDPQADAVVDTGTEVSLTVSKPLRRDTVPEVRGHTLASAESTLIARHFTFAVTDSTSIRADSGRVLRQEPPGGTQVSPGSEVELLVGSYVPTPLWLKLLAALAGIGGGVYGLLRLRQLSKDRPWRGRVAMTTRSDPGPPGRIDTDNLLSGPDLGLVPRVAPITAEVVEDELLIEGESS